MHNVYPSVVNLLYTPTRYSIQHVVDVVYRRSNLVRIWHGMQSTVRTHQNLELYIILRYCMAHGFIFRRGIFWTYGRMRPWPHTYAQFFVKNPIPATRVPNRRAKTLKDFERGSENGPKWERSPQNMKPWPRIDVRSRESFQPALRDERNPMVTTRTSTKTCFKTVVQIMKYDMICYNPM